MPVTAGVFAVVALIGIGAIDTQIPSVSGAEAEAVCAVDALRGLRSQLLGGLRETRAQVPSAGTGFADRLDPPRAADFSLVAHAILGSAADAVVRAVSVESDWTVDSPTPGMVPCGAAVRSRDALAWRMGLSGYSAQEIADVLGGHLALGDVRQARARLLAGWPSAKVVAFLESRWQPSPEVGGRASAPPAGPATAPRSRWSFAAFEPALVALALQHGLSPDLVRAVVAAESGGNPRAVSSKGAIGLMQLMPGTAAALGVDPWQPFDNLRGGVAYLAGLLRSFGNNLRLALIAYNAGPQHAREVQAGRAVAYRETRVYLDAINARYPLP